MSLLSDKHDAQKRIYELEGDLEYAAEQEARGDRIRDRYRAALQEAYVELPPSRARDMVEKALRDSHPLGELGSPERLR